MTRRPSLRSVRAAYAPWLVLAVILVTSGQGCGDDVTIGAGGQTGTSTTTSTAPVCAPNQQIECPCGNGVQGVQACLPDGSGYTTCSCPEPTGGSGGSTTGTGGDTGGNSTTGGNGGTGGMAGSGGMTGSGAAGGATGGGGAGGMTGSMGGGGAGPVCVPATQASCYTGPGGTENVGPCHGGTKQCKADGSGYGPCVGEITPQSETCNTPVDDDCDGQVNESGAGCVCAPNSISSCYTGPAGTEGVGTCKAGTHICNPLGTSYGPCTGEVLPAQDLCATAADEDCNGSPMPCVSQGGWSKSFGALGNYNYGHSVAIDGAGDVYVCAEVNGADFGGGPTNYGALAKFDSNGAFLWSKTFRMDWGFQVTVDGAGNPIVAGAFLGTTDFGGGQLVNNGNQMNVVIAKLDSLGNHVWSKQFGTSGFLSHADSVAVDAGGSVYLGGSFRGNLTFGGATLMQNGNNEDGFVAKLSSAGAHVWSKQMGSASARVEGIALDSAGNAVLAGWFSGSYDFGSGAVMSAGGSSDYFVAKLGPNGAPMFAKAYGDVNSQLYCFLGLDASDDILLTGGFNGNVDFGGGLLAGNNNNTTAFVAKFDAGGAHLWSKSFGNTLHQIGAGITADPSGNVLVIGSFQGLVDFGGGAFLSSAGLDDAFLLKYGPAGATISAKRFGSTGGDYGGSVASDLLGAAVVTGSFSGTVDFGQGGLMAIGNQDIWLAKVP